MPEVRHVPLAGGDPVSAAIVRPAGFRPGHVPAIVLAHGAGTDRTHPALCRLQTDLAATGLLAVTFNFPYRERGGKLPDRQPVLEACYRSVVNAVRTAPDLAPPWLAIGGRSMGGRMATHLAAAADLAIDAVVLLGYPLSPAGRPETVRADHLPHVRVPTLFVQGARDALCDLDRLRPILATMPAATLHVIDHADHGLHVPKRSGRTADEVHGEVVRVIAAFLTAHR